MIITYAGILFCLVSFKTIYFVLYCNLLVVIYVNYVWTVSIQGPSLSFTDLQAEEGYRAIGDIPNLCPWIVGSR